MKMLFLSLIAMTYFTSAMFQDDTHKLIEMALKAHVSKFAPNEPIYLMSDNVGVLPPKVGSHTVQLLGDSASKYLGGESSIHGIKINPLKIDKGKIIITLTDYIIRKGDDGAYFSFGGGKEYVFSYIDSARNYKLVATKVVSY